MSDMGVDTHEPYTEFYILSNPPLLPHAVGELVANARGDLSGRLIEILFDPEHGWFKCITLTCDKAEAETFIQEALITIVEEETQLIDPDTDGDIRNDNGNLVDVDIIADEPSVLPWATFADNTLTRYEDYDEFRYPAVLKDAAFRTIWRGFENTLPIPTDKFIQDFMSTVVLVCGSLGSPRSINDLGSFLNCQIFQNLNVTLLYIGCEHQGDTESILRKLDNIANLTHHRNATKQSHHIVAIGTDESNSWLCYKWLNHLGLSKLTYMSGSDGRLLPLDANSDIDLSKGASLRLARMADTKKWTVDSTSYPLNRQAISGLPDSSNPFAGFKYPGRPTTTSSQSVESKLPQTGTGNTQVKKKPMSYAQAVDKSQTTNQRAVMNKHSSSSLASTSTQASRPSASRASVNRPPAKKASHPTLKSKPSLIQSLRELHSTRTPVAGSRGRGHNLSQMDDQDRSRKRLTDWVEKINERQSESGQSVNEPSSSMNETSRQVNHSSLPLNESSILDHDNGQIEDLGDLISFDEPALVHRPTSQHPTNEPSSSTGLQFDQIASQLDETPKHDNFEEDLIDLSDDVQPRPTTEAVPSTGDEPAVFGRQKDPEKEIHQTMRQKAGRKAQRRATAVAPQQRTVPGHETPSPQTSVQPLAPQASLLQNKLISEMKSGMKRMTEGMQLLSGEIELQVKFGRLYVTGMSSSSVATTATVTSDLVWNLESACERLKNWPDYNVGFQTILTTKGSEVYQLVGPYFHEPGEPRWNQAKLSAAYSFTCLLDHAGEPIPFRVDVDVNTFEPTCRSPDEEVDRIYVHCPEHAWDMKVCATRALVDLPDGCGAFAEKLVGSLKVSTNENGVTRLEVAGGHFDGVTIKDACIQHLARYSSKAQNGRMLVIRMTKPITATQGQSNRAVFFHGTTNMAEDSRIGAGRPSEWFEVSLVSTTAEEAFQQNKGLELGQRASWTPEMLEEGGAFEDICFPALCLISKMDNIGSSNNNGRYPSMVAESGTGAGSGTYHTYAPGFW